MPFNGIYNPEQLATLSKVLNDHCQSFGIEPSSPDHEHASYLLMTLFEKGVQTAEELQAALEATWAGSGRREA